jgi:hypothetical protein
LDLVELVSSLDQYQEISKHPAWVFGIGGRINKGNKLVRFRNIFEESIFELSKRRNLPFIVKTITKISWSAWPSAFGTQWIDSLSQEKTMLSAISAISPRAVLVCKSSSILSIQLSGLWLHSFPDGLRMQSWEGKPISERILLQVCERKYGK